MSDITDLDALKTALADRLEELATDLLGEPNPGTRRRAEWRWGNKGSRSLKVRGPGRGDYYTHEGSTGGGALDLIMDARGCGLRDAIQFARGWTGLDAERPEARRLAEHARRDREAARRVRERETASEEARRAGVARNLAAASRPLRPEDPGWAYLTVTRAIPPEAVRAATASGSVLWHPGRRAVVFIATDAAGEVRGVQLVHVLDDGAKRLTDDGRAMKISHGVFDGAAVRLPGEASALLLLAEGPETAMAAWAATGRETWIALGSIAKVQPPPLRRLCVCADDDQRDKPAAKSLGKAIGRWRTEGRHVAIALPWARRRFDGSDFNDVLRHDGLEAVRARIEAAIAPPPPPPGGAPIPVELARHRLGEAVAGFFREARGVLPGDEVLDAKLQIVQGVRVGVGVGKSDRARREASRFLAEMRAAGDGRTIVFAVPTHKLGEEQARAFERLPAARAAGLRAAVWRGREAPDPEEPGEAMCRDLEAVHAAQFVGVRVESAVCRSRKTNTACPYYGTCGYQRQKRSRADLWFVPHELLFTEKPAALGTPAAVIVDENAWTAGLEGVDGAPMDLALDALDEAVVVPSDVLGHETQRLRDVHRRVRAALDDQPDGPLRRDAMLAAGLDVTTGQDGHALSWRRVINPGLKPGMSAGERRALVKATVGNRAAMRCARFFGSLAALLEDGGPEASGWASLAQADTDAGRVRVLRLRGRRRVAKGWHAPTLILDALLDVALVRPFWPSVQVTATLDARAPHMCVRQLTGRDWPKTALVPDEYADAAENERRLKNSERLRAAVLREVRATAGRVLVIVQKAVEDYWRQLGNLPNNLELAHHNAIAGRDEWGPAPDRAGVRKLIVIGRTLPRPKDVERITEALTGAAVTARASGRYERHSTATPLADGTFASAEADRHPDPLAEAVRWQICEGELVQIIGRGRGVNRTAADPLDVLVLTDRPLPLPVDETVTWEELMPSPADLMLSQGGVALEDSADAARCYPGLWGDGERPSPEAARKAFQRARCGTNPNREFSYGECPAPLRRAEYQRAGTGKRRAALVFDPSVVPLGEVRTWLEDRLGPLAAFDVSEPPPPLQELAPSPQPRKAELMHDKTSPAPAQSISRPPQPPPRDAVRRFQDLCLRFEAVRPPGVPPPQRAGPMPAEAAPRF